MAGDKIVGTASSAVVRRVRFAVGAAWGSQGVGILVNLVQIPLLFQYLDREIVGIWFLMIGAQSLQGLFDFGFGQTLQRRIAFAKGTCGWNPDVDLNALARQRICDLLLIARRVYSVLSAAVLAVVVAGGLLYFGSLDLSSTSTMVFRTSWLIMCIGYAANMWGWYVTATLNGLGDIGWSNIISSCLWLVALVATWVSLAAGWGLPALAVIWAVRGVLLRSIGWLIVRHRHPWVRNSGQRWRQEEFSSMIRPALRWWAAIAGYFCVAGINRYFVGAILGAKEVPDYVATYMALGVVQGALMPLVTVTTPLLSQMWKAGDLQSLRLHVLPLIRLALALLAMGYSFVCVYAKEIFQLWLGPGHFVGYPVVVTLSVMMFLGAHHGMMNAPCIAAEHLQFYKYTLLGGLISIVLTPVLVHRSGLLGAASAMLAANLLTQNWIIPVIAIRLLKARFSRYVFVTILPPLGLGAMSLAVALVLRALWPGVASAVFGGIALLVILTVGLRRSQPERRGNTKASVVRTGA